MNLEGTPVTIHEMSLRDGMHARQHQFTIDEMVAVATALDAGYRHVDTAAIYRNEAGVGRAVAASGLDRAEIFITTKVWNTDQGYDSTLAALDASLERGAQRRCGRGGCACGPVCAGSEGRDRQGDRDPWSTQRSDLRPPV